MADFVQTQIQSTSTEGRSQVTTENGGSSIQTTVEAERTDITTETPGTRTETQTRRPSSSSRVTVDDSRTDTRTEHTPKHDVVTTSVRDGGTSTTTAKAHIGINVRFRICVRTIEGVAEGGSDLLSC